MQDLSYTMVDSRDGTTWVLPRTADSEEDSFADGTIAALDDMIASDELASSAESATEPLAETRVEAPRVETSAQREGAVPAIDPSARRAAAPSPPPTTTRSSRSVRALVGVPLLVALTLCAGRTDWTALARSKLPAAVTSTPPLTAQPPPPQPANHSGPFSFHACLEPPKPCRFAQAVLSLGLGAIGIAVGVPYVPGMTDNLLVGALAGLAPLLIAPPGCETITKAVTEIADLLDLPLRQLSQPKPAPKRVQPRW
jgi:hypothetical protein